MRQGDGSLVSVLDSPRQTTLVFVNNVIYNFGVNGGRSLRETNQDEIGRRYIIQ